MAVKYPDILEHNNATLALVDSTSLRGNVYPLAQLSNTGSITADKRQVGMLIFASGSQTIYGYYGQTTSSSDWDTNSNWKIISNSDTVFTTNQIISGSISATVNTSPSELFIIKSGSVPYLNISSSGNTELYSDLFIIKNFTSKQPVLTISQSIIQFVTQSNNPTGTAPGGSFWFTSTDLYVALD